MEEKKELEETKVETVSKEDYLKLKRSNVKKKSLIVILIFTLVLVTAALFLVLFCYNEENKSDEKPDNDKPVNNTVKYENKIMQGEYDQYGVIYLKGYTDVKTYTENYEGSTKEDKYDLISFHITDMFDAKKEEIAGWVSYDENNNIYVRLGCVENDIITFSSVADEWYDSSLEGTDGNYWKTISLNKEESKKIISSNINNPITLKLEKLKFSYGGREGNHCTTSITGIELIDNN